MVIKIVQRNIKCQFLLLCFLIIIMISFSSCSKTRSIRPIEGNIEIVSDSISEIQLTSEYGKSIMLNLSFFENVQIDKKQSSFVTIQPLLKQ